MKTIKHQLLEIFSEMTQELSVNCKYCFSSRVVKNGSWRGTQRWLCRACGRGFTNPEALPKAQFPMAIVGSALDGYYSGMSLKKTGKHIQQDFGVLPSHDSIYKWLNRFIPIAVKEAEKHTPKVSDRWVCDETVLSVGGKKLWLHSCLDSKTRFLLATHLSPTRTTKDSLTLLEKAKKRTKGYIPKVIVTDGLRSYADAVEIAFGSESSHIKTSPFGKTESTNLVERWQGTLKDRFKVLRGLQTLPTARVWLDGFEVYYNYLRIHETLGETPASKADIKFPFSDWKGIVRSVAYPEMKTSLQQSPKPLFQPIHSFIDKPKNPFMKRKSRGKVRFKKSVKSPQSITLSRVGKIASWRS